MWRSLLDYGWMEGGRHTHGPQSAWHAPRPRDTVFILDRDLTQTLLLTIHLRAGRRRLPQLLHARAKRPLPSSRPSGQSSGQRSCQTQKYCRRGSARRGTCPSASSSRRSGLKAHRVKGLCLKNLEAGTRQTWSSRPRGPRKSSKRGPRGPRPRRVRPASLDPWRVDDHCFPLATGAEAIQQQEHLHPHCRHSPPISNHNWFARFWKCRQGNLDPFIYTCAPCESQDLREKTMTRVSCAHFVLQFVRSR